MIFIIKTTVVLVNLTPNSILRNYEVPWFDLDCACQDLKYKHDLNIKILPITCEVCYQETVFDECNQYLKMMSDISMNKFQYNLYDFFSRIMFSYYPIMWLFGSDYFLKNKRLATVGIELTRFSAPVQRPNRQANCDHEEFWFTWLNVLINKNRPSKIIFFFGDK